MEHQFRNAALGGFHKQDVLDYLEANAKEQAQRLQDLQQKLDQAEGDRAMLDAQCAEQMERIGEMEQEFARLSVERDESVSALNSAQAERRTQTIALEQAKRELEESRRTVARLEPDATAYSSVKERAAGMELDAHRRAQSAIDQSDVQVRQLRQRTEQWILRVQREYDALRTQVGATVAHAAEELEKAGDALGQVTQLMADQDIVLDELAHDYTGTNPERVPAPVPLTEG